MAVEVYVLHVCARLNQHRIAVGGGVYSLLNSRIITRDVDDGCLCLVNREENKESTENDSCVTHKTPRVLELEKVVVFHLKCLLCEKDFYSKNNELFSDVKKILLDRGFGNKTAEPLS